MNSLMKTMLSGAVLASIAFLILVTVWQDAQIAYLNTQVVDLRNTQEFWTQANKKQFDILWTEVERQGADLNDVSQPERYIIPDVRAVVTVREVVEADKPLAAEVREVSSSFWNNIKAAPSNVWDATGGRF